VDINELLVFKMGRKRGSDIDKAQQIRELLERTGGEALSAQFIAKAVGSDQRRVKRLLQITEILKPVERVVFNRGKRTLYLIQEGSN